MRGIIPHINGLLLLIALTGLSGGAVSQETFNFELISNSLISVNVYGIEMREDYAYCADGYGMSVWDLSDPDHPEEVSRCQTPGNAVKIALYGDYAYIADSGRGVAIINIQTPEQPRFISEMDVVLNDWDSPVNVDIHDNLLLISNSYDGLVVASLDDPENPEIILQGEFEEGGNYTDLLMKDDVLFVNDRRNRSVLVVDLSEIDEPVIETEISGGFAAIDNQDDLLAVLGWDTLFFYSIEEPTEPERLGYYATINGPESTFLNGEYAILGWTGGIVYLDISDPARPVLRDGTERDELRFYDCNIIDNTVYAASGTSGIGIASLQNPENIEVIGRVHREYHNGGIEIEGGTAFIFDSAFGMRILDVSDIESPEPRGTFEIDRDGQAGGRLIYNNDIVYMASDFRNIDSLHIIDVSDLDNPVQLGSMQFAAWGGFDFVGDYLYMTGNLGKNEDGVIVGTMLIIDVSDPSNPHTIFHAADGARDQGDRGHRAVFLGDYMFQRTAIPGRGGSVQDVIVYSLENPAEPELLGRWPEDTYAMIASANGYLYCYLLEGENNTIAVYSVDNPLEPELVGLTHLDPEFDVYPRSFYVEGDLIYCGDYFAGINVISVADPENPHIVGYLRTPGELRDFEGVGRMLYVGDEDNFGIYRFTGELNEGGNDNQYSIPIREGWSFISAPISPEDRDIISVFEPIVESLILAKDCNGHFYSPPWEFNNIPFWDYLQGYQVKMSERRSLIIAGDPVNDDTSIPVRQGWSFAPYYPDQPMEVEIAFENIQDQLVMAKDANGRFYLPEHNFNNMPRLRRGRAYQVRSNADVELVWNVEGNEQLRQCGTGYSLPVFPYDKDTWATSSPCQTTRQKRLLHFVRKDGTGSNMSILVTDLVGEGEIGAFTVSGICVGATAFRNQDQVGLAVWGDDESTDVVDGLIEGEAFTLKLWNSTLNEETDLEIKSVLTGFTGLSGSGLVYEADGFAVLEAVVQPAIPEQCYLSQNYPNPFNAITTLSYGLPENATVSIQVYDTIGRLTTTLLENDQHAGHHKLIWDARDISSGVYLVQMKAGGFTANSKVVLVK